MVSRKTIALVVLPCILLASCNKAEKPTNEVIASGAKSAVITLEQLLKGTLSSNRPSANLGVYIAVYASQGIIFPTQGAQLGMEAITKFLEAQSRSDTDENFALLREVGAVLQVNIVDTLNRSTERAQALETYTQSLRNAIILAERKMEELQVLHDNQRADTKTKRDDVRALERRLRTALKDQDYAEASDIEEELSKKTADHAEIEIKAEQTDDMIDRFDALLEVAKNRLQAVQNNREILIAGLRVIDVPGIKDLNILEKGRSWSRRGKSSIFN